MTLSISHFPLFLSIKMSASLMENTSIFLWYTECVQEGIVKLRTWAQKQVHVANATFWIEFVTFRESGAVAVKASGDVFSLRKRNSAEP